MTGKSRDERIKESTTVVIGVRGPSVGGVKDPGNKKERGRQGRWRRSRERKRGTEQKRR